MEIIIAENAGFCFGVKRATDSLEKRIADARSGERIFTLGALIHNDTYNRQLKEQGVEVTDINSVAELSKTASADSPVCVFIRAHGIPREDEALLKKCAAENEFFSFTDCTCPYVKKIHRIAAEHSNEDNVLLLLGKDDHPEVVGILSYFDYEKVVFSSADELSDLIEKGLFVKLTKKRPILAAQTTQKLSEWRKAQELLKKVYTNPLIFDTICSVTEQRQTEARRLSAECDAMVVIGGRESSNTAKLFAVCKENCQQTIRVESADELGDNNFITHPHAKVGIAAGASTPSGVIKEVYDKMSEKNFEQLLAEESDTTLHTGDIVTGIVTYVTDAEIQLDLGAQVTGIIKAEQITDDASVKLTQLYKKGDTIEARVGRVSDIEGIAELSKKFVDAAKNWQSVVDAHANGTILTGKVVDVFAKGVSVLSNSTKIFVPASQSGVAKGGDLNVLKGAEVEFKVIDIEADAKKAVGSISVVSRERRRAQEEAFWSSIEEGKVYTGVVKSMTAYGAFVDLGGVDGMVHKTELSWKPIATPAAVVSVGQEITVFVKSFDAEKKRISLGYKTDDTNPWYLFTAKYAVGDVAAVKIVSLMPFGAFAEICDGVDGLIHISQIAQQKIGKPADVLEVGQVVDAKIIAIDEEKQKVSLSIRALLDEAQAEAEAMPEDYVEETVDAE